MVCIYIFPLFACLKIPRSSCWGSKKDRQTDRKVQIIVFCFSEKNFRGGWVFSNWCLWQFWNTNKVIFWNKKNLSSIRLGVASLRVWSMSHRLNYSMRRVHKWLPIKYITLRTMLEWQKDPWSLYLKELRFKCSLHKLWPMPCWKGYLITLSLIFSHFEWGY